MVKKKTQDEQRRFLEKLVNKFNTQNPTKQFILQTHERPIEEKEEEEQQEITVAVINQSETEKEVNKVLNSDPDTNANPFKNKQKVKNTIERNVNRANSLGMQPDMFQKLPPIYESKSVKKTPDDTKDRRQSTRDVFTTFQFLKNVLPVVFNIDKQKCEKFIDTVITSCMGERYNRQKHIYETRRSFKE